jgi:hypothetical protein
MRSLSKIHVTARLHPDLLIRLEEIASTRSISRNEAIELVLEYGVNYFE